jgi:hypothetical protein
MTYERIEDSLLQQLRGARRSTRELRSIHLPRLRQLDPLALPEMPRIREYLHVRCL